MKKLLSNMIKDTSRKAEFFCLKISEKETYFLKRKLSRKISKKIIEHQDFGYDSVFITNDYKHEMNKISHRIKTFNNLIQFLNNRNF
ncbi:non-canonical purine NTP pyrophosphatase [Blattabacterium cuenoti]|uniref:non-canonical purine NTP pyrophosphatase n=1 Tax=Blattabacterium cuenoti TaxID=1653831 RepID=UPI00163C454C|nr:non-canonical purine NTP pyrophosphatase [Blattabacterium cuenoti]